MTILISDNFLTEIMFIFVNSKEHDDNESSFSIIDLLIESDIIDKKIERLRNQ